MNVCDNGGDCVKVLFFYLLIQFPRVAEMKNLSESSLALVLPARVAELNLRWRKLVDTYI